ncbi:MAG: TolC family protein [Candidatus Saganbacteria bacterium]|nr:TolC family protein [Candidatus Saganbacteria bacterium]
MRKKIVYISLILFFFSTSATAQYILPLDEFIKTTIQNNPRYQISVEEYKIALEENIATNAIDDWNLIASGVYQESNPAPLSSLSPTYKKTMGYSLAIEKYITKSGTAIQIEQGDSKIKANYSSVSILSPYYVSNLSLTISQPLLRNAFGRATKMGLEMADLSLDISKIKLEQDWEDFIAYLREEYLIWQNCQVNVEIYEDKVETVEKQTTLVEKQYKFGLSEKLDLVQIKQKQQAYKIMFEQAKMEYENQGEKIVMLMNPSTEEAQKNQPNAQNLEPQKFEKNGPIMDEKEALTYLTTSSNLCKTTNLLVTIQKINLAITEDDKLMDLNLIGQVNPNALTYGAVDSLTKIGSYNEYSITLSANTPITFKKMDAQSNAARQEYQKALKEKDNIMLNAEIGLSNLYTSLAYSNRMLTLNEKNVSLAKERMELEQKKFDQGRSSVFFLLNAEDDLLAAQNTLKDVLFTREKVLNQIMLVTDRYLVEYEEVLSIGSK